MIHFLLCNDYTKAAKQFSASNGSYHHNHDRWVKYQIRISKTTNKLTTLLSKTTIQISLLLCATNGLQNMECSRQVKLMWECLLHLPKCIAFTIIMHVK